MDIDYPNVNEEEIPFNYETFIPRNRKEFDDYCEWLRESTIPESELENLCITKEEY